MPLLPGEFRTMAENIQSEWAVMVAKLNAVAVRLQQAEVKLQERDHANTLLRWELGSLVTELHEFLGVMMNHALPEQYSTWPERVRVAWSDLQEVIDSAEKCLR